MRIAFATCSFVPDGRDDDRLVADLLGAEFRVWNDPAVDWTAYDRVVIRSTWDYSWQLDAFLGWCASVGDARLRNHPATVAWNARKTYLGELHAPTVSTVFIEPGGPVPDMADEVVVKPHVSAGGRDTGRFTDRGEAEALISRIHASGRTALLQPYLPSVASVGETAVVFIGGAVSHVLHKREVLRATGVAPLADAERPVAAAMLDPDLIVPGRAEADELAVAEAAHGEVARRFGVPLYARIDLLRDGDGSPLVSEVEVIEPGLLLADAPGAVERFADAIRADAP